jgi:NAD+ synthase
MLQLTKDVIEFIRKQYDGNPDGKAIIGISGGKDSTIAAALCVEALGADRVIGVLMPQGTQNDIKDSYEVCN